MIYNLLIFNCCSFPQHLGVGFFWFLNYKAGAGADTGFQPGGPGRYRKSRKKENNSKRSEQKNYKIGTKIFIGTYCPFNLKISGVSISLRPPGGGWGERPVAPPLSAPYRCLKFSILCLGLVGCRHQQNIIYLYPHHFNFIQKTIFVHFI